MSRAFRSTNGFLDSDGEKAGIEIFLMLNFCTSAGLSDAYYLQWSIERNSPMTLKQAHWPGKVVFEIKGDYLFIKISRWGNYNEDKILLDNISGERLEMRSAKSGYLLASIVFAIITTIVFISRLLSIEVDAYAELIWLALSLVCLLLYYRSIRRYAKVVLQTGGFLYIATDKPNRAAAAKFIDRLLEQSFLEREAIDQKASLN